MRGKDSCEIPVSFLWKKDKKTEVVIFILLEGNCELTASIVTLPMEINTVRNQVFKKTTAAAATLTLLSLILILRGRKRDTERKTKSWLKYTGFILTGEA